MEKIKKIKFELIQMEKNYQTNKSIFVKDRTIFIVGRSNKLGKKIFFVNDFYPRFYVEKGENIDFIIEEHKDKIKEIKTKEDGEEYNYKNLGGKEELITIYIYKTSDIEIRDLFSKTYQANIKFTEVFKREKLIKDNFYVPEYVFEMKTRTFKIYGIEYIMIKENEIDGGELIF